MSDYVLARDIMALGEGLNRKKGRAIAPGEVSPALWQRWLADGVVEEREENLAQLRERAKVAGVEYYWSKSAETLREELDESN